MAQIGCKYCNTAGYLIDENYNEVICFVCKGTRLVNAPEPYEKCPECQGLSYFKIDGVKHPCKVCRAIGFVLKDGLSVNSRTTFLDKAILKELPKLKCYILFIDIVKYSKRRPIDQYTIIKKFYDHLKYTFQELYDKYNEKLSGNGIYFFNDIITMPLGDGMAIVIPFEDIANLHLKFAEAFLKHIENSGDNCEKFTSEGYCDDHDHYKVRIGLGNGDCILYKDYNNNYNFAGNEINLAARVMGLAGYNQVIFTEHAYNQYKEFTMDFSHNHFKHYPNVKIKHDECIDIYHYIKDPIDKLPLNVEHCEIADVSVLSQNHDKSKITPKLNDDEFELLKAASQDESGQIIFEQFNTGFVVQSNEIQFNQGNDAREKAKWLSIINTLMNANFIMEKRSRNGMRFLITDKGFQFLNSEKT